MLLLGFYLAAQPDRYLRGARRLLAPSFRCRAEAVLRGCGRALRWWMGGQLIGMALVGGLLFAASMAVLLLRDTSREAEYQAAAARVAEARAREALLRVDEEGHLQ